MSTLTINLDENTAQLVEEAARIAHQSVDEWVLASIAQAAASLVECPKTVRRVSPLHPGAMSLAPDFNAPLEEFAPYS